MPPQPWKTVSTRQIYKNDWMRLREDVAALPNGRTTIYGVCEFGECVGALPFVDNEHVLMIRQFRYVQGENQRWEMPTGGLREGETPERAAQRELMEEGGIRAGELLWVSSYFTSKSVCDETAHIYLGRGLSPAEAAPDETEFIERGVFTFDDVLHMVETSEIRDSMTVIAVLHAARLRAQRRW
jgi:8-oxo-dGTP pyrophosphatase MutT (NUDIX family)